MNSEVLRPLDLPLNGLRLIEASAGTGKTYTIAMLYVRLVLGHDRQQPGRFGSAYLPPDILVLTFTDAAAGELRDRIRRRLAEAALVFRAGKGGDALLAELLADYAPEQHEQAAFVLEQAAQWLDEAAISTIHAWCLRVLQQHAFDSGSLFAQTLVQDLAPLREQAVRDVWRRWFYPLPEEQTAVVARLLGDPAKLARRLLPLLGAGEVRLCRDGESSTRSWQESWLAMAQAEQQVTGLRDKVWQGWPNARDTLLPALCAAVEGKALSKVSYKPEWLLTTLPAEMAAWQAGRMVPKRLAALTPEALRKGTNKGRDADVPISPWCAEVADFLAAEAMLAPQRETLTLALLTELRQAVLDDMDRQLRQRAEMSFDDLLKRVDAALRGPHGARLAARLRTRCPVALIDEFQDTDPLQFRIFEHLYRDQAGTALLMIGDPKQAIYSFRGADLPTYLHARRLATPPQHTLDTNFRSDRALVDGVNALFAYGQRWPGGAFAQTGDEDGLQFTPVAASRAQASLYQHTADGQWLPLPALQLALPDGVEVMSKGEAEQHLAAQCADTLLDWLTQGSNQTLGFRSDRGDFRALGPGDIAVLVRKGTEARVLRQALLARGIPSVYGSDRESVYASAEAAQLQRWLEAFAEPGHEERLRLALATPALGRRWQALMVLRSDERAWEHEVEQVRETHVIWRASGVLAAVRHWLFLHEVPARLLHPDCQDGERALTNLLHLAELLQTAAAGLHGEQALIRHLAERREGQGGHGGDDALVRLESDSARVRVVTLHQSKGLEYPVVCLPFTAMPGGLRKGDLRRYHRLDGELVLDLASEAGSLATRQAEAEQLQEDLRLFYVGVTRPQHLLWIALLPVSVGGKQDGVAQHTPWSWLLAGGENLNGETFAAAVADVVATTGITRLPWRASHELPGRWQPLAPAQALLPARVFPGLPPVTWRISSYSGLRVSDAGGAGWVAADLTEAAASALSAPEPVDTNDGADTSQAETWREQTLSGLAGLPRGAEIGSFWHSLLEEAAAAGFALDAATTQRLDDFIARQCRQRHWDDQTLPLQQALRGWLRHPLQFPPQPDGNVPPVALHQLGEYQVELEFWFASHVADIRLVDRLICRHTLSGRARPALLPARLDGLFKGFMDLVFVHQGRYYVADYKSNHLADDATAYHAEALAADVAKHRYDLQYVIYLLALHRQLRTRLPGYDYDLHMGGAVYLYLRGWDGRGHGIHVERPPRVLIDALDRLFAGADAPGASLTHADGALT